ncbi:hypothetical protein BJ138DRAFT_1151186 [Hygrophoropsis aurantiaca]|uniref:Uncharacterized protein n=1 Tax=Hygrophoropsis aurantiaca TaxID=72124 RepID=A0ACB8AD38_9AGAM|nr:hypothetical protein BJ138DRAFT_1151186 [Hygrophoropsis aurantiaca]
MTKAEKEEMIKAIATRIFSAMVDDLTMDAALRAHHEVSRSRAVCHLCQTRCGMAHSVASHDLNSLNATTSHPATPSRDGKTLSSTGTNTPTKDKSDGNIFFKCVNCDRQIASNRYAPHLSACMGIGAGMRRGAARGTNLKTKIPIEPGRSASPYLGSDSGHVSDDNASGKGKGKSKGKRADDAEFNLKRKRAGSPQVSPPKKQKKQKTSGSPVSRIKADLDSTANANKTLQLPSSSQTKVPSKLRASSTASFLERDRSTTPSSHASSAGTPMASRSTPSISAQSPAGTGPPKRGRPKGSKTGMGRGTALATQIKRPSPPRPPPPPVRIEPDYLIDVEGDETGSSTDTDSS